MKNNTGKDNSGDFNSGSHNSGDFNSGSHNSGHRNSGHRNSGYYNSGSHNSGSHNSGDYNSGYCNSGDFNSGYRNSGHRNSGYCNSGYCNSGDCNSGDYNSGYFNTDEPNVRLFNKDTNLKRSEIDIPYVNLPVTEWIPEEKMTEEQKKADPEFFVKKGTLIKRSYKEAWCLAWKDLSEEVRQQFLALPNFDADIFLEITGVDVRKPKNDCVGKIVEIAGKKYRLQEMEK